MKALDISKSTPTLTEVLKLAGEENVILRVPDGREFVVAEVDDFDREIGLVRQQGELMQLLAERGKESTRYSVEQVREQLRRE